METAPSDFSKTKPASISASKTEYNKKDCETNLRHDTTTSEISNSTSRCDKFSTVTKNSRNPQSSLKRVTSELPSLPIQASKNRKCSDSPTRSDGGDNRSGPVKHATRITGNNKCIVSNIRTVPQQGFLSVYRLHPDTKAEELTEFLKNTAPNIPFKVGLAHTNDTQATFKVSFPICHLKEVYNSSIWPLGTEVRQFKPNRFHFRKNQRTQMQR